MPQPDTQVTDKRTALAPSPTRSSKDQKQVIHIYLIIVSIEEIVIEPQYYCSEVIDGMKPANPQSMEREWGDKG